MRELLSEIRHKFRFFLFFSISKKFFLKKAVQFEPGGPREKSISVGSDRVARFEVWFSIKSNRNTFAQCKKNCRPQGITNYVKSCLKLWCKINGIHLKLQQYPDRKTSISYTVCTMMGIIETKSLQPGSDIQNNNQSARGDRQSSSN
jgi:hypothetical protein